MKFTKSQIYALAVFLLGIITVITGATLKINHADFFGVSGTMFVAAGLLLQAIGIGALVFMLLRYALKRNA